MLVLGVRQSLLKEAIAAFVICKKPSGNLSICLFSMSPLVGFGADLTERLSLKMSKKMALAEMLLTCWQRVMWVPMQKFVKRQVWEEL